MTKFYKELTDEELKLELNRLEDALAADGTGPNARPGLQEVLKIYWEELRLRQKLNQ